MLLKHEMHAALSSGAMVNFALKHCKRLGMKFKMADVCEKDMSWANFELTKTLFFKFS